MFLTKTLTLFRRLFVFAILTLLQVSVTNIKAQIEITYSADNGIMSSRHPDISILTGNVTFLHDNMILTSDSALYDKPNNKFDAFKNIVINVNDTMFIYGDMLHYDGNTKIAEITGNVRLVDDSTVLRTNFLQYDRVNNECFYPYWGHTTDSKNELFSRKGYYYTLTKDFFFKDSVVLQSSSGKALCDTLQYNTITDVAYFLGPTHIYNKENYIYSEWGWYNTTSGQTQSTKNSMLKNKKQVLTGDSIYYDRATKFGRASGNVEMSDSINNVILKGEYAETNGFTNYSFVTQGVTALFIDKVDTLFLHSDTISAQSDSMQNFQQIVAFHHVKFYRSDLQGLCDSMHYTVADSLLEMYGLPVSWSGENQFSADTIKIETGNEGIKMAFLYVNSFIISLGDTSEKNQFNQLKGRDMTGYFLPDRTLRNVDVKGNSEMLYYIREDLPDKTKSLIGINVGMGSDMKILLEKNTPTSITTIKEPVMVTYPEEDLSEEDRKLKNFKWIENRRPKSKEDIYNWE